MSDLVKRIRSAGYWDVEIYPATFKEKRIERVVNLYPIIEKAKVSIRGWDFPHLDFRQRPVPHRDFVQQESETDAFLERWRFYQSGQFKDLRAMFEDWRNQSQYFPATQSWKRGDRLGISDALFTFYEIYEFAARLANTDAGDDRMVVNINVSGLQGRALVMDDPRRGGFFGSERAVVSEYRISRSVVPRSELMASSSDLALTAADELFQRFGSEIPITVLRDWLRELITRMG